MSAGVEALELAGFAAAGAGVACLYLIALAAAARRLVDGGARAAAALTAICQIMRRLRPEGRDGPMGF